MNGKITSKNNTEEKKKWHLVKDCSECVKGRLKSELSWLKRKGAVKVGHEQNDWVRACGRCQTELGIFINRGALCPSCKQRVCKNCRKHGKQGKDWLCIICSKQIEIQLATGEWINEFVSRPSRRKAKNNKSVADGVKNSLLRRSWTISSPTTSTGDLTSSYSKNSAPSEATEKLRPPAKPPRRSLLPGDENVPQVNTMPRCVSMLGFDSLDPEKKRSSRSVTNLSSHDGYYVNSLPRVPPAYARGRGNRIESPGVVPSQSPPKYFFGAEPYGDPSRASTLPRRPRHFERPESYGNFENDVNRFHSVPRTKPSHSFSRYRDISEPARWRDNSRPQYSNSGSVACTPIKTSTPNESPSRRRERDPHLVRENHHRRGGLFSPPERYPRDERRHRNIDGGDPHFGGIRSDALIPQFHNPNAAPPKRISPHTSDEGINSSSRQRQNVKGSQLPRSNTSVTSGRDGRVSTTAVRRANSFHTGSTRRSCDEELCLRKSAGGQVAKFVHELERGIHNTVSRMNKRFSNPIESPISRRHSFRDDRSLGVNSNLSSSDISLNERKFIPEGNDYKIVFISSDSSKESGHNSSIESERSFKPYDRDEKFYRPVSGSNDKRTKRTAPRKKFVDVAVMTEPKDTSSSDDESFEDASSTAPQRPSSPEENYITDAINSPKKSQNNNSRRNSLPVLNPPRSIDSDLLQSVGSLNQNELNLMLQQTEVVQAEAQALQKALMKSFDIKKSPKSLQNEYGNKGKLNDSLHRENSFQTNKINPREQNVNKYPNNTCTTLRDFHNSSSLIQELHTGSLSRKNSRIDNDYENIKVLKKARSDENLYENINIKSDEHCIKPMKVCKSIAIQTDLEPFPWEEEDSYETADYSDVSFESNNNNSNFNNDHNLSDKTQQINSKNKNPIHIFKSGQPRNHDYICNKQSECSKGKGQESFNPSYSYLPNLPQFTSLPHSPAVLSRHDTSIENFTPVSLSSQCGVKCDSRDVICGRVPSIKYSGINKNVNNIIFSNNKVNHIIKGEVKSANVGKNNTKNYLNSRDIFSQKVISDGSNVRAENVSPFKSGVDKYSNHIPTLNSISKITKKLINTKLKMNTPIHEVPTSEKKELPDANKPSDVNASEEVILPKECSDEAPIPNKSDVTCEEVNASDTSEEGDTDEDIHVTGSYDVSRLGNDSFSDSLSSNNSDISKESLSTDDNNSETDGECSVTRKYVVTKPYSGTDDEVDSLENSGRNNNKSLKKEKKNINNDNSDSIASEDVNAHIISPTQSEICDTESNNITNIVEKEEKASISNNLIEENEIKNEIANNDIKSDEKMPENIEKTDLPECDQAMGSDTLYFAGMISSENKLENSTVASRESPLIKSATSSDICESSIENKSETESIIGQEAADMLDVNGEFCDKNKKIVDRKLEINKVKNKADIDICNNNQDTIDADNGNKDGTYLNESIIVKQQGKEMSDFKIHDAACLLKNDFGDNSENNILLENNNENKIENDNDKNKIKIGKEIMREDIEIKETDTIKNEDKSNNNSELNSADKSNKLNEDITLMKISAQNEIKTNEKEKNENDILRGLFVSDVKTNEVQLSTKHIIGDEMSDDSMEMEDNYKSSVAKDNEENERNDKSANCNNECKLFEITGSIEVEQGSISSIENTVTFSSLKNVHERRSDSVSGEFGEVVSDELVNSDSNLNKNTNTDISNIFNSGDISLKSKENSCSSESNHSSGGESDLEIKKSKSVVKIDLPAKKNAAPIDKSDSNEGGVVSDAMCTNGNSVKQDSYKRTYQRFKAPSPSRFSKAFTPPVPLRKAKRSSSSDGISSSSDIERSDADISDSAETLCDSEKINNKLNRPFLKKVSCDTNLESDGPSSADSLLQGTESESHCSDGSEEGNLVTIVAVGEDNISRTSSRGKIYIRSDSTDSDVQIKPTCIVVSGISGVSEKDCNEDHISENSVMNNGNDVTILEVTSDHRKDHVMSVRVTSPELMENQQSQKTNVNELQSIILTTRERQQQFRRSPTEIKESSSGLTNYFTVTLGSDSPATPRRLNKTPEIRRRKLSDKTGINSNLLSTNMTPSATLTPSPTNTPSPTVTPIPDHSEGDLLAYEDSQADIIEPSMEKEFSYESDTFDSFNNEYDEHFYAYADEGDATFDSIEDAESLAESNYSESSSEDGYEREEEIRGYCKRGCDFTLHTIIEESCEESDYDKKAQDEDTTKRDPSELEKYFYFDLGNGPAEPKKFANEESEYSDTFSETSSSIYSEGIEVYDGIQEIDPAELASSRLEKYFSGFSGFERQPSIRSVGEESEVRSDESGSVGSDSEGSSSPEQPRKRLYKSRGVRSVSSSRSHGYSSDKGEGVISDGSHNSGDGEGEEKTFISGEDEGSTESEETAFDKGDGQFDTIKRRKKKKALADLAEKRTEMDKVDAKYSTESKNESSPNQKGELSQSFFAEFETSVNKFSSEDTNFGKRKCEGIKENDLAGRKYQSRDSGFIGSSDDLLKDKPEDTTSKEIEIDSTSQAKSNMAMDNVNKNVSALTEVQNKTNLDGDSVSSELNVNKYVNEDKNSNDGKVSRSSTGSSVDLPPYSQSKGGPNLSRKDSFNNWSSDEETNIMMNKMRIFFKNMFSNVGKEAQKGHQKIKSPQLVMFEAKLTNLMRSVPGINDEQVREIVEYLSSEETWSDSYDSSDYTSSDLEGAYARLDQADPEMKSELQEQISASCQQIIKKFDKSREPSDTDSSYSIFGGRANSESSASSKDTAFVYQKLISSISHLKPDSDRGSVGSGSQSTSPSLLMKVMPYIRERLVALMHEVSAGSENGDDIDYFNGGNPATSSPRQKLFLPKKYNALDNISFDSSVDKSSLTSTSFESEESPTDTEQSPESETGTPKIFRHPVLSVINEKSSTEDFTSLDNRRPKYTQESHRHNFRNDALSNPHISTHSHRSGDDRSASNISSLGRNKGEEKYNVRTHSGLSKASRNCRRPETRKAKSHLNLEKIHQEELKSAGERSESLGDLLDRVRSSSEFSSSYEQIDSDSTLKASDSLDRHIGSSSSNVRLNASSRGSLTTSSRGSLATSSRGSLNASSRSSLQGSSGPEEEEDRKVKKLSFFRYPRRSSVPDASKDGISNEVRSTTLPRSTPAQILTTGTLPRSQSSQGAPTRSPSTLTNQSSTPSISNDRSTSYQSSGPRSARYHPPGYRPPSSGMPPKRTFSTPSLRKEKYWHTTDESLTSVDDATSVSSSTTGALASLRGNRPASSLSRLAGDSPLKESLGRGSGKTESVGGSLASFENANDEEAKRRDSDGGKSPLIALGPKSRSESLASVYSSLGESRFWLVSIQGEVQVALQFNYKENQLECHIIQCRELAIAETKKNKSDPYLKAYLLPDKSKSGKRKTKVKRNTTSPVFDEIFKFGTTLSELESKTLWMSVWHSDTFGRNVFLGEVFVPLSDTVLEDSSPTWHALQEKPPKTTKNTKAPLIEISNSAGAVLVLALKFVPPDVVAVGGGLGSVRRSKRSRGVLQVRVKEALGLKNPASRNQSPPDPMLKGVLVPEKGKGSKQKSNIIRKSNNPRWNHTMSYDDVTLQELVERSLELAIWNYDRFSTTHEFLGGVRLNVGKGNKHNFEAEWCDGAGLESKLWSQMLDRPNLWVESKVLLRNDMETPIYPPDFKE